MPDWIRTLLELLSQVAGGRTGNQITNNAIAAIFWSFCLAVAVARYREDRRPRERLLIWGFSVVLGRELFMIFIEVLRSLKLIDATVLNSFYPPLQHALHDAGLITVAAGFMGFLAKDVPRAGRFLRAGMAGTVACYLATFWWWAGYLGTHPGSKFAQTWCDWPFHINGSVWLLVALVYLMRHTRGWVRNGVCGALAAFFFSTALKLPDLAMKEIHEQVFTQIRYLLYLIGGVTLSYVFIREQFSERREYARSLEATMRDQQKAEAALRESEERLRTIIDSEPECVKLLAADGSLLEMNPAGLRMIEADSLAQVRSQCVYPLVAEEDREAFRDLISRVMRGESGTLEYAITGLKGTRRWLDMHASPMRDATGRVTALLGVTRDITARRQAEAAVRESEQRFRELFEGSPDAIFVEELDGWVLDVNPAACRLHGMERAELIGRSVFDLVPPGQREAVRRDFARMVADEVSVIEGVSQHKDGRAVSVEVRISRIAYRNRPALLLHVRDVTARRNAVLALQESRLSLEKAQQIGQIGSWQSDPSREGRLVWSAETERIFGFTPGEFDGRVETFFALLHPEDRETVAQAAQAALAGERPYDLEHRIVRRDGQTRWVREQADVERDAAGQPVRMIGVVQDITERRKAEESLEMMRVCVDRAGDSVFWISREGGILYVNDAGCTGRGYSREELLGMRISDLDPDYQPGVWAAHFEHLKFHRTVTLETRHRAKDGQAFPVEVSANYVHIGGQEFNFAFVRDITARRAAEEKIRQLAAFPELNPNPVLEFSADGALIYHNRAASELSRSLGVPDIGALLPADTREIVLSCLAANQPRLRIETALGPRMLSWSFYPIGELRTVHCYVGEITERLRLEEQLRQSQKMEAIGQLAGGVAHDFNNILTVIQGYGSMLLLTGDPSDETVESVRQIVAASERAANLTRQLLLFSRRQVMQPGLLNLNDLVTSLVKMLQRIVGEDVKQQLHLHPRPLTVYGDAGMLDQVLMNLVVNARDAMPGGGRLIIETAEKVLTEADAALIPNATPGRYACLSVTDSGSGIAPEALPHIFEPFFTTKEIGKGTGLGLATVFGIVQQHGGALQVESEVGRGTTLHIFLPTVEAAEVAEEKVAASRLPRGTETILVVEDEPSLRVLNRIVLERQGYQVLDAAHGVEALQVWEQHTGPIHLLLTDLVMPEGLSGLELAARLRKHSPDLPVIFTSGYSAEMAGRELRLETGQFFLQKPTPLPELLETVRRCLDR